MKTIPLRCATARQATIFLILFLTGLDLWAQVPPVPATAGGGIRFPGRNRSTNPPAVSPDFASQLAAIRSNAAAMTSPATPSGLTPAAPITAGAQPNPNAPAHSNANNDSEAAGYNYNFQGVPVEQVLEEYSKLVNRTLLRSAVSGPPIILKTRTLLTKTEAIEALQAVLALNGIEVVNIGDKFVKVLPPDQAGTSGVKVDNSEAGDLPELGGYVTHIVHMNYVKPSAMQTILASFSKLPNAILPIDDNGILVLRDHAENVKRMLEMIDQVDTGGGTSEIVSEVIPIRYALAGDIANALNSLGGSGGGGTVSIGSTPGTTTTGSGGGQTRPYGTTQGGINQPRTIGSMAGGIGSTPNGTPASGAGTFQSRLLSIVNNAAQSGPGGKQDPIQIFGQTKIIADNRSNSLLIFATRQDMESISNVIAKLDVLLSQVLIESVIIDVDLVDGKSLGVSVAQNPKLFSTRNGGIAGGGGSVNGPTFLSFLNGATSGFTNASTVFGNNLGSGLSYFGNIGPTWDVALKAAANDSSATVIQRPRIQTSQAKAATFKFGSTVPYITSSYNGGSGIGASSSYSQLFVGVELDITPFINPDGLVVMDINQSIDDLGDFVTLSDGSRQYSTTSRALNSEIAVKDKDTIMLGGFIRSDKKNSKSGVPYLQDIPLLGYLFSQHASSKNRQETVVLIRPTVLRSPDDAATQSILEQKRLPGITAAASEDAADELKQVEAESQAEAKAIAAQEKAARKGVKPDPKDTRSYFQPLLPDGTVDTNKTVTPNP